MKKIMITLCALFASVSVHAKLKVVATLPVFASITQEIGKDQVDVVTLGKPSQDPHFIDPKPSYVVALSNADALVHSGLELESGWLPPLISQSRNSKILPQAQGNVDLSVGLAVLEVPSGKADRSEGDIHPSGNPHVWMDPRNVSIMSQTVADRLGRLDPQKAAFFRSQATDFQERLSAQIKRWEEAAMPLRDQNVITYHKSFSYLLNWLGMRGRATIEPKPGIPPSSSYVETLTRIPEPILSIVSEDYYPKKMPEYLSEKMRRPWLHLATQPDLGESYTHFIDRTVQALRGVAGEGSK